MSTEIKRLDLNATSFMANGKEYFIEPSISVGRNKIQNVLRLEFEFGMNHGDAYSKFKQAYESINNNKLADTAVALYNNLNYMQNVQNKYSAGIRLCTLFCNTKDEDRRYLTEAMIEEKIKDWAEEGYDEKDFFTLAVVSFKNSTEFFKDTIQSFLNQNK